MSCMRHIRGGCMGDDLLNVMTDIEKRGKDLLSKRESVIDWVQYLKNLDAWLKEYGKFDDKQIAQGEKTEGFERLVNIATKLEAIRTGLVSGLNEETKYSSEDMDYINKIRDLIDILGENRISAFFHQQLDWIEEGLVSGSGSNIKLELQNLNILLVTKTPRDTIIEAIQVLQEKASHLKGPNGNNIREELKQISESVQRKAGAGEFLFHLAKISETMSKELAQAAKMKKEKTPVPIFGKILDKTKESEANKKKTQTPQRRNPLMQHLRKHPPETESQKNTTDIPRNRPGRGKN